MTMNVYSIFDRKSLIYNTPWFQPTHGAATRILEDLVNDLSTNVGRHPNDYVLYCIGSYDDQKGLLIPIAPLVHVMDAIALVKLPPASLFPNVSNALNGGVFKGDDGVDRPAEEGRF